MPIHTVVLTALLLTGVVAGSAGGQATCQPTRPDMLGPFYKPDAPARSRTGEGLVVSGVVRSAATCAPLPGARIEWWSADGRGEYQDSLRATQVADGEGRYRYETVFPGQYPGRPPHLHVRLSAPGHRVLVTQIYPRPGERQITFDFVLPQ
jgi:protocatechuate 3,4-dioxygenase beta subunit